MLKIKSNKLQISFQGKSLREAVIDALDFIGVIDCSDFDLKKEYFNNQARGIHDNRHLYRVMLATALIAQKLNEPRKGLLAFCGAYIHDLARQSDIDGAQHGPWAAQTKWDMFNAIWDKYQLTDEERSNVRAAVSRHSEGGNSGFKDDALVSHILHDADALDRCRFRQHGRLNWSYLSLPELRCTNEHPSDMLKTLMGETEAICGYTKFAPSFGTLADFIAMIR